MGYMSELMGVFQRGMIVLWRNKLLFFGNIIMPLAVVVIFGPAAQFQIGDDLGFDSLSTGMLGLMCFFSGMFIPNNLIWDRDSKFLNILFVSPCNRSSIILGYSLVGAVRSVAQTLIIYIGICIVSSTMGYDIVFSGWVLIGLIAITILMSLFVGGFMTIIASYSKNSETFFMLSGMIGMPLMFLSNVFFTPASLPFGLGIIGRINPLNYMIDTVRYLILGVPQDTAPWEGPVLLVILAVVFTFLGTYVFVRTVKK
jgi:ABC-2 type transport system permease protein